MTIGILEDDVEARQPEMLQALDSAGLAAVVHDNSQDFIGWLGREWDRVRLVSLDHDLGPNRRRGDQVFDPGTGMDVVNYLCARRPAFPVVVHSSNPMYAPVMVTRLESAGWRVVRVIPLPVDWIRFSWLEQVRELLAGPAAPASPPPKDEGGAGGSPVDALTLIAVLACMVYLQAKWLRGAWTDSGLRAVWGALDVLALMWLSTRMVSAGRFADRGWAIVVTLLCVLFEPLLSFRLFEDLARAARLAEIVRDSDPGIYGLWVACQLAFAAAIFRWSGFFPERHGPLPVLDLSALSGLFLFPIVPLFFEKGARG